MGYDFTDLKPGIFLGRGTDNAFYGVRGKGKRDTMTTRFEKLGRENCDLQSSSLILRDSVWDTFLVHIILITSTTGYLMSLVELLLLSVLNIVIVRRV
jgi:hypothetical protein